MPNLFGQHGRVIKFIVGSPPHLADEWHSEKNRAFPRQA